jgi:SulP family sulfate permease
MTTDGRTPDTMPPSSPAPPDRGRLSGDLWGGLAAMLVAVPSSIAFGLVIYSSLGPAYAAQGALAGIIGAVVIGLVASLAGGAPRLISAPCAPAAAVLAALAGDLMARGGMGGKPAMSADHIMLMLTLVAAFAGVIQFLFGSMGGGRAIKYIPYPVVAGYLSAVGVLIILSQIPKLFGFPKGIGLWTGLAAPSVWESTGLAVGTATIVVTLTAPLLTAAVPATILGLAGGLAAYFGLALFQPALLSQVGNPLVIGPVGGTVESMALSAVEHWRAIGRLQLHDLGLVLVPAATLAVLLSIDTLKTCVIVDALTRSRHDSNRELIGQGTGNIAAALAGGVPGAGTLGATLVNLNSGGNTRLSGILEGLFALAAFLLLGNLMSWVPLAALAGILLVVGARMVDLQSFYLLKQKSTLFDFIVVAAVVATAIGVNLIAAAGVGLGLSILLFVREQIGGTVVRRKSYGNQTFSKKSRLPEEVAILERKGVGTAVYELQGNLFFGTTDQLFTELEPDLKTRKYVVLDMRRVQSVDFTAAHLLKQIEAQLAERNGVLIFSDLPHHLPTGQDLEAYFAQLGLVQPSQKSYLFPDLDGALEWIEDRLLKEERLVQADRDLALTLADIDLFKGLAPEVRAALESCVTERSCREGEPVFSQGDVGDELFLIRRGTVRIQLALGNGKRYHLATFGKGDFFGDMSFLDSGARSADAVASAPTDLYVLSRNRFNAVVKDRPLLGEQTFSHLARALAIRLRQTNVELRSWKES